MTTNGLWGGDIDACINDCKAVIEDDYDNVHLYTGPEGVGKSTIKYQVQRALDPTYDESRIHFKVEPYMEQAPTLRRGQALDLDESPFNKRMAMHGNTTGFLDWIKDRRGLNLNHGIAYPHDMLFDDALKNFRIRLNWDVIARGLVQVRRRVRVEAEPKPIFRWEVLDRFRFLENHGRTWLRYLLRKENNMRGRPLTWLPPCWTKAGCPACKKQCIGDRPCCLTDRAEPGQSPLAELGLTGKDVLRARPQDLARILDDINDLVKP